MIRFLQGPVRHWEQSLIGRPDAVFRAGQDRFWSRQDGLRVEALTDEEGQSSRDSYEVLRTVTPVLTPQLEAGIDRLMECYPCETGRDLPAAWCWPIAESAAMPAGRLTTNRAERLDAVLWIVQRLPAVDTATEAANQVACVLDRLERCAYQRAVSQADLQGWVPDPKGMRLTAPLPELCEGRPILVAYGIRHVTLFQANGAIQVQRLPEPNAGAVHYRRPAGRPGMVLLDKPGQNGCTVWE